MGELPARKAWSRSAGFQPSLRVTTVETVGYFRGVPPGLPLSRDPGADAARAGAGEGGEGAGPGDVAMAVGVESVRAFSEHPFGALELFAEREVVRGDVLVGAGDALLSDGKLAHQGEAEVVLLAAEVDGEKAAPESFG